MLRIFFLWFIHEFWDGTFMSKLTFNDSYYSDLTISDIASYNFKAMNKIDSKLHTFLERGIEGSLIIKNL